MPNLKVVLLAAALVAATGYPTRGAEANVQELSLRDCIDLALQHNLDLQIERRTPLLRSYGITEAVGAYYDPVFRADATSSSSSFGAQFENNVLVAGQDVDSFSASAGLSGNLPVPGMSYNLSLSGRDSERVIGPTEVNDASANWNLRLTQPLLRNFWIDGSRAGIEVSRNSLEIAELTLKRQVMNVINQVERAYYNLIFAYENVQVQEMSLELAERSLSETQKRFEVGTVAELETKQTESQVAGRRAGLLSAQRNLELQQNVLKRLISDNYLAVHDLVLQPTEPLEAPMRVFDVNLSWDRGLTERPDLQQARIQLENIGIQLRLARNQLLPQLDVFGSIGGGGSGLEFPDTLDRIQDNEEPSSSIGVVLSYPLGNRAARSRYRSRQTEEEQLLLTLKNLEQGIMVEIDDAIKQAASEFDQVQATEEARIYAEAALEAEQKRLENGKSTSFVVLSLQNDLTTARSAWIRAKANYLNALAELAYREGHTLKRHQISWDSEIDSD